MVLHFNVLFVDHMHVTISEYELAEKLIISTLICVWVCVCYRERERGRV